MRPYVAYGFRQASDDAYSLSKVVQFFRATNQLSLCSEPTKQLFFGVSEQRNTETSIFESDSFND